jgi:hypothetical protein
MILPGWFLRVPRSGSTPHDDDRRRTAEPALPPPRIRPKFDRFLAHEHKDVGDGLSLSSSSSSRSLARAQAGRSAVVGVSRVGPAQQASQGRPLRCWQQSGSQEERVVSLLLPVVSPRTTLLDGRHARGRASSSVRAVRAEGRAAASSGIVQRHPMRVLLQSSSQRVVCRGGRPRVGLPLSPLFGRPAPVRPVAWERGWRASVAAADAGAVVALFRRAAPAESQRRRTRCSCCLPQPARAQQLQARPSTLAFASRPVWHLPLVRLRILPPPGRPR